MKNQQICICICICVCICICICICLITNTVAMASSCFCRAMNTPLIPLKLHDDDGEEWGWSCLTFTCSVKKLILPIFLTHFLKMSTTKKLWKPVFLEIMVKLLSLIPKTSRHSEKNNCSDTLERASRKNPGQILSSIPSIQSSQVSEKRFEEHVNTNAK